VSQAADTGSCLMVPLITGGEVTGCWRSPGPGGGQLSADEESVLATGGAGRPDQRGDHLVLIGRDHRRHLAAKAGLSLLSGQWPAVPDLRLPEAES